MIGDGAFSRSRQRHPQTWVPKRSSKHHPLSVQDKLDNHLISSFRVPVEHAIGGMKRFGVMSQPLRNRIGEFDDQTALLAAGLWNYQTAA